MKSKIITLSTNPEFILCGEMWAFSAVITGDILTEWCMSLILLRESLIESLIILGENSKPAFTLIFIKNEHLIQIEKGKKDLRIFLGNQSLHFLCYFYLTYYRDGEVDVNHIDLQTIFNSKDAYLTFYAEKSKCSLSPDKITDDRQSH